MRASRLGAAALVAAAAVTVTSCPEKRPYEGREIVTFFFHTKIQPPPLGVDDCRAAGYLEIPTSDSGFSFSAVFSGDDDGTIRNLTLGRFVREASFDGAIISSLESAPRVFRVCQDAGVADEQLYVVPLSLTQLHALDGGCPANPTAPGAIPVDPDAGIFPPGVVDGHFEAISGCGVLIDTIHSEAGQPACPPCTMTFEIEGPRL